MEGESNGPRYLPVIEPDSAPGFVALLLPLLDDLKASWLPGTSMQVITGWSDPDE